MSSVYAEIAERGMVPMTFVYDPPDSATGNTVRYVVRQSSNLRRYNNSAAAMADSMPDLLQIFRNSPPTGIE